MISSVYNGYMIMKQLLLREIIVGFFVFKFDHNIYQTQSS